MAQPLGNPYSYFTDTSGNPLAGGKIYTYAAGTTTPQDTYTDASGTVVAANPVVLDSAGRATIWLSGNYKIAVANAADTVLWTTDNITAASNNGDMTKAVYDAANVQEQLVGLTATQTLTNKTLSTGSNIDGAQYSGAILQTATASIATWGSTTSVIPFDNTVPQNTEGTQFLTVSITPKSASSTLRLRASGMVASSGSSLAVAVAAFRDSTASAIAASAVNTSATAGTSHLVTLTASVSASSTSSTTFALRYGLNSAGTAYINGGTSANYFGGVESWRIVVEEIKA